MKVCPKCNQTYSDDSLNFCLEDGSVLTQSNTPPPPATVMIPDPRESVRQESYETSAGAGSPQSMRQENAQPKRSKTWLWALGALFGTVVVCGGGLAVLFALAQLGVQQEDDPPKIASPTPAKGSDSGDPDRRLTKEDDFDDWSVTRSKFISSEHRDNAFVLTSADEYYYVILVKGFTTYDSSTLLTVRNVSGDVANSGYGLIFHSSPDAVLKKDYAFLIRSDNGTYRIVKHTNSTEKNIVNWTKSTAINRGTAKNDLEVRADGRSIEFFINGKSVKEIRDSVNYKDGIAGIYTSDDIPIAFSKIELRK